MGKKKSLKKYIHSTASTKHLVIIHHQKTIKRLSVILTCSEDKRNQKASKKLIKMSL